MEDSSESECNFIFNSSEEEEYQADENDDEKDEDTLQVFNLLNNQKVLSPYSNIISENSADDSNDETNYDGELQKQNNIEEIANTEDKKDSNENSTNEDLISPSQSPKEEVEVPNETEENMPKSDYRNENHDDNSSSTNSPRRKKKKVHPNQIPPRLLVTRNEINKENEAKIKKEKPKKISKKEMKKMINRLMKPPQAKPVQENEELPKSKTQANPQTFDRLYQMSKEKVKKCEQLRKEFEEEEINYPIRKAEKSNKKSTELAEHQLISFIEAEFPNQEFLNETELNGVLKKLGILDNKELMYKNPAIKYVLEGWMTENEGKTVYDASRVKESLISSATQRSYSKFDVYARQRMTIEISEIKQRMRREKPEPPKEDKKISKETIMRLSQARDPNPPCKETASSPSNLKPRPKPKPKRPIISEELPPEGISQKTQEILETCDLAHIPFEERERINAQKRSEKIKKLDEEIHNKKLNVGPQFGQKPQWSSEVQQKLDEYRQKKINSKPDEPSYKPNVMSFEMYQKKVRKQMMSEQTLPEGYKESVNRHRQAYQQGVQKKMEKAKRDPFYELTNIPL